MYIHLPTESCKAIVKQCYVIRNHDPNMYPTPYELRNRDITEIGVDVIDCIMFAFLGVTYTIKDTVLMHNLLLVINAMFVKTI